MNLGGNPNNGYGWFLSSENGGPTPSRLLTTTASLHLGRSLRRHFLRSPISISLKSRLLLGAMSSSLKIGIFNKKSHHLRKFNFVEWSNDSISEARFLCLSFFDGNQPRKETRNEGGSSQEMSIKNPPSRRRWTTVLLAVNVLVYVAQMATQGKLMLWGAKINSLIDKGQLWRLVTSSFLHANIGHLMVNCFSLNSIGPTVENICGTQRFFTIYFASALASSALSYWLCDAPSVGASGAIFGLVGSVAIFSLRHRSLLGSGKRDLKHIAQVIFLNMMIGLVSPGIDNWGHLGGLVGGAAISWLIGPAWKYEYTDKDGRRVFVDRPPISYLSPTPKRIN